MLNHYYNYSEWSLESEGGSRSRFDLWMRVTAPAREGRKEGAKNIKTYWHISRFTYGKLL